MNEALSLEEKFPKAVEVLEELIRTNVESGIIPVLKKSPITRLLETAPPERVFVQPQVHPMFIGEGAFPQVVETNTMTLKTEKYKMQIPAGDQMYANVQEIADAEAERLGQEIATRADALIGQRMDENTKTQVKEIARLGQQHGIYLNLNGPGVNVVGPSPQTYAWSNFGNLGTDYTPTTAATSYTITGTTTATSFAGWNGAINGVISGGTATTTAYCYPQSYTIRYDDAGTAHVDYVYQYYNADQTLAYDQSTGSISQYVTFDPIETIKQVIKGNVKALMGRKRSHLDLKITPQETKARDTLRDMISEEEYRRYLTNGFVMVKGQSGKFYQIFSSHQRNVLVYEKGKHINNICIHTDAECPPTDHVISMKVMIELDEQAIYKEGNLRAPFRYDNYGGTQNRDKAESLVESFKKMKAEPRQQQWSGWTTTISASTIGLAV